MGYTVLCLSLRLAPVAIVNLLHQTKCATIVHGQSGQMDSNLAAVAEEVPALNLVTIPSPAIFRLDAPKAKPFVRSFDRNTETNETGLIMHSSGSTGLPKPVFLSHRAVLTHAVQGAGLNNFGALPLYHMYGLSTTFQAMYMGKTANLISATMPMTADNLVRAVKAIQPEVIHAVPYALGLMVESEAGINALKAAKIVTAAGARTPDELGDKLVSEGVEFGVVFGTTEAGLLGDTMRREPGDDTWGYVRIYPNIRKSIFMDPLGDGSYECIYLKSHPGLSVSDSDYPAPGSWKSKDVFIPHPTKQDVWKYITRLDDRVTLSNGEKVLPLPIEGRIRQDDLVREAVVVGVDRAIPGLLLFRSDIAVDLSDEEVIEKVWPAVVDANASAEAFSQITREMITVLPFGTEYPRTDKGSIIRAQCYRKFSEQITELYARLDRPSEGTLRLDLAGIESFLMNLYEEMFGVEAESTAVDFFTAGIDSLQAIEMRRKIQQNLDLGGNRLSSNVVYEQGNIAALAKHLFSLGQGESANEIKATGLMRELVTKYSAFGFGDVAILTGATGSLGAHTLVQMVNSPKFLKVYCLVRGSDPLGRVLGSVEERGLHLDAAAKSKIVAFAADVSKPYFGLGEAQMQVFLNEVTCIAHLAWPVNFSIRLPSFEPHLLGLQNLLSLSTSVHRPEPARLYFASSISTAERTPGPAFIHDGPIENFEHAMDMGYAQSKLVGENMVINAARAGARAYVLRIGQIVGDHDNGIWNEAEFIPSIIRSALSLGALPDLPDACSWLPVDTLATAMLELDETLKASPRPYNQAGGDVQNRIIYNMVNPRIFEWKQMLEELHAAGLKFDILGFHDWLAKLQQAAAKNDKEEEKRNPAVKLLHHLEERYVKDASGDGANAGHTFFDTKAIQRDSNVLRSPPDIIRGGYVRKFLESWLKRWAPAMVAP
jgi:thioester reductase-like protein